MKVLIVDDHAVVRSGLQRLFQGEPDIEPLEATDAIEALAVFAAEQPDVVIIDINLPGMGGLDLLRRLVAERPTVRALIFSMHAEPIYATEALRVGALGYVSKIAPSNEILDAVRSVAGGARYIDRQIAQELALSGIVRRPERAMGPALSVRETELLRLLAEGRSLSEMAEVIGVSYKTVANSLSLLKSRLGVATTAELISLAIRQGYAS
ncbi:DNA-binding response regulator [Aliidongia dinghuensis]|uniref:DNA-binding response regulator n=1 Tax=Aliidongia dinghuensis TaxID=1867774 RepID=A0A8J3E514_9PROT|nr:response regulator transcription factor [Aliidongia dinghuensis]GGF18537.1 DNA-binding response regulator [Aliidongia dinghuensis]